MSTLVVSTSTGKDFPLMNEGINGVTLTDIKDLGQIAIPAKYQKEGGPKTKHKVRFKWTAADQTSVIRDYTFSLHEKATLRKDLKAMLGKDPGTTYDLMTLLGSNCQLVITHAPNADSSKTFANITAILKAAVNQKTVLPAASTSAGNEIGDVGF